jgi:hypothetical protein
VLRYRLIVLYACTLHVIWGIMLLLRADAQDVTALEQLNEFLPNLFVSSGHITVGLFLLLVSALAIGTIRGNGNIGRIAEWLRRCCFKESDKDSLYQYITLLLILPQQFVVVVSLGAAVNAMQSAALPFVDQELRWEFIVAQQAPQAILGVLHTLWIWSYFGRELWPWREE